MKTLKVYTRTGFTTYPDLYTGYIYHVKEDLTLIIYEIDRLTGSEDISAIYKDWDSIEISDEDDE